MMILRKTLLINNRFKFKYHVIPFLKGALHKDASWMSAGVFFEKAIDTTDF